MSRSEVTTEGSNLWAMTDALKGPHLQRLKQGDRTPENRKQRAGRVIQMDLWSRARPAVWQPPTGGELGVGRYGHKPLEQSSIGALANWATGKYAPLLLQRALGTPASAAGCHPTGNPHWRALHQAGSLGTELFPVP